MTSGIRSRTSRRRGERKKAVRSREKKRELERRKKKHVR